MKKLVSVLLVVVLMITSLSTGLIGFAESGAAPNAIDGVSVSARTTQDRYNWGDEIYFDVDVTNNGSETLENLVVSATPRRATWFWTKDGSGSARIDSLAPGETKTVQLMFTAEKLPFFVRMLVLPILSLVDSIWGLVFNSGLMGTVTTAKVGLFPYRFAIDVSIGGEETEDSNLSITIDQEDFTTTDNIATITGNYECSNLDTIAYVVDPFFYETGSSTTGEVIIDGNTWSSSIVLQPGDNRINFTVKSLNGEEKTETITVTYNYNSLFSYEEEDISTENNISYLNNIIGIYFEENTSDVQIESVVDYINGELVGVNYLLNKYWIRISRTDIINIRELAEDLEARYDYIICCTPDYLSDGINLAPNDIWLSDTSNDDWNDNDVDGSNWGLEAIEAQRAWDHLDRMSSVKIGVIDNGFSTDNRDLNVSVLSNQNTVESDVDHGTHVTGTIGGIANNIIGHTGIMYNKGNMLCFDAVTPQSSPYFDNQQIESGLVRLVTSGAKVINCSFGCESLTTDQIKDFALNYSAFMYVLLKRQNENGDKLYDFLIVQAAGNNREDSINAGYFASITNSNCVSRSDITKADILSRIVVVAAAEQNNGGYQICDFSNSGSTTEIAAPGRLIFSTDRTKNSRYVLNSDLTLSEHEWSGTSMAAPHVSGVAGLVWAINPSFTGAEVKSILIENTTDTVFDNPNSPKATGNYPLVNAKLAVEEAIRRTDALGTFKARFSDAADGYALIGVKMKCTAYEGHYTGTMVGNEYTADSANAELQLPAGTYTFKFTYADYIPATFTFTIRANETTNLNNISLSKEIGDNEVRVVLHWGTEKPSDLDSHFNGKKTDDSIYHVYFSEMGTRGIAWLDIDDTDYEGPETVTINMNQFDDFTYSVHNYSNRNCSSGDAEANVLATSGAYVEVFVGTAKVATYNVPTNRMGTVWNVFKMDKNGTITFINSFDYISSPSSVGYVNTSNGGGGGHSF